MHYRIEHGEIPPSLNRMGFQNAHWAVGYRKKKQWADTFGKLLLAAGLQTGNGAIYASVRLHFTTRHRHDVDNYRSFISKALGDTFSPHDPMARRYIPDDTDDHFRMDCAILEPHKTPLMVVELTVYPRSFSENERRHDHVDHVLR